MYRIIKILMMMILFIVSAQSVQAQIRGRYAIGSIGNLGATVVNYSGSYFIGGSDCLDVSNGLTSLTASPKKGDFNIACKEVAPKEMMQIIAYPNPVTSYLTVKTLRRLNLNNTNEYFVKITGFTGNVVKVIKTDLNALDNGLRIQVDNLIQGYYSLTLYSAQEIIQTTKIIKN